MKNILLIAASMLILAGCTSAPEESPGQKSAFSKEAQEFIDSYTRTYVDLYTKSSEAEWKLNTMIVKGDSTNDKAVAAANEAFAKFTGGKDIIAKAQELLKDESKLSDLQQRQLEGILFRAGNNPETVSDLVKQRIEAQTRQVKNLYDFTYKLNGKAVTTNDIDRILRESVSLSQRRAAWEESKKVGQVLKPGLANLRDLRNNTVQALGYNDFFTYQVSEYGMSTEEMMKDMKNIISEIWPLYRELHTYARYELAKKYGEKTVPEMLPAHWLPNRWGQDWSAMIDVKGVNLDSVLKNQSKEWIVEQGERFYVSLGFDSLPNVFWDKSSLYPLPANVPYKKNNHASAWHIDLGNDVRSLMSVEPNADWYETSHHELGHIYYYMTYTNPDVPPLLREGANRAYHEAIGSLMGLAAMQKPFLQHLNLLPANAPADQEQAMQTLLKEAMSYVVFLPFGAGTMTEFEHDLYVKNLPVDQYNARWWELARKYQGMVPPAPRGEEFADAASKTHINDDAAQYYDYAISFVLLFQLHDHIAKKILNQDPRSTNYFGSKEVGNFLRDIMYPGSSRGWKEVLKEKTGEDLSAKAMLSYFEPLMAYLKQANAGRAYTLPAQPAM